MSKLNSQKLIERIAEKALKDIGEHAESVVIIVTKSTGDGKSSCRKFGLGNYFAQRGSVEYWMELQRTQDKMDVVNERRPQIPPTEDGDEWKRG